MTPRMFRFAFAAALVACATSTSKDTGDDDGVCDPELGPCVPSGDGCESADRDGDGWSDEVEIAMETSAADAGDSPTTRGQLVFVMPYKADPHPAQWTVDTHAKLARADVAILLDTTGSMTGTTTRIQGELAEIVQGVNAEVEDVAFGAAGYGDFPVLDGANSHYDVPFYLVHRVMTARTPAGLSSITQSFTYRNIIGGTGNWFSIMRGGDEPEQHWEALRQAATGAGIAYPSPWDPAVTWSIPAFSATAAYPAMPPAGEEVGAIGGYGFRRDATPIILMITDTNAHAGGLTTTTPVSATRAVALSSLRAIGARVVGIMAWLRVGEDDLTDLAIDSGGLVPPTAWGTGAARPANCPAGKCCVVAEDEYPQPQPDPSVNGMCPLVFQADRYSQNLSKMVVQAITAIANGARFRIAAELRDDGADSVDVTSAFVDRVDAVADGPCAGGTVEGNAFPAVAGGERVCFRITAKPNTAVESAGTAVRYRAVLQLTGDGVGSFNSQEVFFVVPSQACTPPVLL